MHIFLSLSVDILSTVHKYASSEPSLTPYQLASNLARLGYVPDVLPDIRYTSSDSTKTRAMSVRLQITGPGSEVSYRPCG